MILVYTVNIGGYDTLAPLEFKERGVRYVVFTDQEKITAKGWNIVVVPKKDDPIKYSREIKINVHKFISGFSSYVYMDANYRMKKSVLDYYRRYFKGGILMNLHPTRDCIFQEADRIIEVGKGKPEEVRRQSQAYAMDGMKRHYGLFQNGFFIRDRTQDEFCEKWFGEVEKYTNRDQLSFPYCVLKYKPNLSVIPYFRVLQYLVLNPHRRDSKPLNIKTENLTYDQIVPKVWYFTPGRGDKNLGRAYNDHCAQAGPGDWICMRDGDTMFLNSFWPKQIEDIILRNGGRYPLISCMTNRLGIKEQLPYGFSEERDIMVHSARAEERYDKYYDEVIPVNTQTAGLFMLFPQRTWAKVKFKEGLTNGGTFIDYSFAEEVMRKLGGLGIANGIYLFHFYRMDKPNKKYIEHLI